MSAPIPRRLGLSLAVVQFFFALSWTVYVVFLPQLMAQVGLPASALLWVLMLDQLIFVLSDYAMGVAADRAGRVLGRLGHLILGATLLSCTAFLLLPVIAPKAPSAVFLALVVLWSVTSSALRAPPLTLIGRYAARPSQPALVAASLFGLGVATAASPYLALALRGVDPRWPFALPSLALALATLGLVAAQRALARMPPQEPLPSAVAVPTRSPATGFVLAALLAACAFQSHVFLASTPLYLRFAERADMPYLAPVFWIGFNLCLWPASVASRRWGALNAMVVAGFVAAVGAGLAPHAGGLPALVALQALTGAAWAALLMSAFALTLWLGHPGREGRFSGLLSSVLALAALSRLGVVTAQKTMEGEQWLAWTPALGWLAAGALLWTLGRSARPAPSAGR